MSKILAVALLALTAVSMVACNTVEGVGKDTQKAGRNLENAADRNK